MQASHLVESEGSMVARAGDVENSVGQKPLDRFSAWVRRPVGWIHRTFKHGCFGR